MPNPDAISGNRDVPLRPGDVEKIRKIAEDFRNGLEASGLEFERVEDGEEGSTIVIRVKDDKRGQ